MRFRQQHYAGRAADRSAIMSLRERVEVPRGRFTDALMTRETPLEPRALEYKLYAPRVGLVSTVEMSGGSNRMDLVPCTHAHGR